MKLVFMSDTHLKHDFDVPDGDVLIHCGDATASGTIQQAGEFLDWFNHFPHEHKIFVPGNHDFAWERFPRAILETLSALTDITCLIDESCEIEGLKFYGSPWQPEFCNWAFNLPRGQELQEKWALIPDDTDVLITHGPPYGILDATERGEHVGCQDLILRLIQVQPKIHAFGHVHHSYGDDKLCGTHFINASICDESYKPVNRPIVVEL